MYARQRNRQMVGPGSGGKGTLEDWKVWEAKNNSPFTSKILQQTWAKDASRKQELMPQYENSIFQYTNTPSRTAKSN